MMRISAWLGTAAMLAGLGCSDHRDKDKGKDKDPSDDAKGWNAVVEKNLHDQFTTGRDIYRDDTFGSEAFWGGELRLHRAILGDALGGVGPGLSARTALELGLKVDLQRLPDGLIDAIKTGAVDLDSPRTTLELLRADSVIGLKGVFDEGDQLVSLGITCAFCHADVDDALTAGIGHRLDGWPNRDLDVGRIVSLAPDLSWFEELLGASRDQVVAVLTSWGPGKYDAQLTLDGKAFRPDGRSAATVIPAAYGMAGQSLHTYTGFGSVPYWNAYVANTQMHGMGTFVDRRLSDASQFPLVTRTGWDNKRDPVDLITSKLEPLHVYQLALPPPKPPEGSYDAAAAARGEQIFAGKAECATCHVPPLYSEPGWPMHTGAEIGIDNFQANRSPERMYRTTPLRGLFTRLKPGLYHDGRFPTIEAVIDHYNAHFQLALTPAEKADLAQFLRSI